MIPAIGIVGPSGTGKTTIIAKLIGELRNRGYKIAAIKHTEHLVDLDRPGKDSMVMHQAGAAAVAIASPGRVTMYMDTDQPWSPGDIATRLFPGVDLVLVESFSKATIPKIGVIRKEVGLEVPDKKGLIALVTDFEVETDLECFSHDQVSGVSDIIEGYIKRLGPKRDVKLYVNEKKIFIKPFIKDFFLKTISAMVDSLRDTGNANRIEIVIDKPEGEAEEE